MPVISEEVTRLIDAVTDLKRYFEQVRDGIESERKALQEDRKKLFEDLDDYIAARLPVTPNLLADTKHFSKMCGGRVNEAADMIAAHSAPWNCCDN